jgi:hypothetical protein
VLGKVVGDLVTTNYGQRSLTETTMSRYKALIGPRLRACCFTARQTEAATGVAVQNRMLAMAMIAERRMRSTGLALPAGRCIRCFG